MSNIVDKMTERLFTDAGIKPGMRVLDIGCGPGAVSFMLAERVGDAGFVYGIDRDSHMVEAARIKGLERGLSNIAFVEGNLDESPFDPGSFDAIVGRRVLMYQPDPIMAVRSLAGLVRPGGLVLFHEHDTVTVENNAVSLPLHDRVQSWLRNMLLSEGANIHMGFALHAVLTAAGFSVEHVRAEANVLTPTQHYPIGAIIRAVLPRLLRHGISTEEEVEVDTLDERLARERQEACATYLWELIFCAWAKNTG